MEGKNQGIKISWKHIQLRLAYKLKTVHLFPIQKRKAVHEQILVDIGLGDGMVGAASEQQVSEFRTKLAAGGTLRNFRRTGYQRQTVDWLHETALPQQLTGYFDADLFAGSIKRVS